MRRPDPHRWDGARLRDGRRRRDRPFSPYDIFARELTVKGSFAQIHCFNRALLALRTGRVRTDGIVTDRFPLSRFGDALAAVAGSRTIKAVVDPQAS